MITEKLVLYLPTNKNLVPSHSVSIVERALKADRKGLSVSVKFVSDAEWKRLTK